MKNPNTNRSGRILLNQLAIAVAIGTGSAHALTTIEVGGAGTIGDTTLTTVAGVAQVPSIGSNWTVVGGTGAGVYSGLVSPAATVGNSGNVTLTFTHRYDFESDEDGIWDGGAVFVSVNGGPFTYVPTESFSSNGYVGDTLTNDSSAWSGGEKVFAGQSAGYATPALITSVATLGSLNATDTVAVEFRGGWDEATVKGPPAWEIGTVQISDTGGVILDVNFTTAGASGFTVANIGTVAGPWTYNPDSVCRFELDADTDTADRYKPDVAGSAINLNGAKIEVALLNGTLSTGDVFSLFDLTGGTTLTGSIASISLPPGVWNTSQISAGGNGTITLTVAFNPNDGTWATDGIGNWSDTTKWVDGKIAYGKDKTATFPDIITANRVVTLDAPVTLGNVAFADATHNLELTGSDLTLDVTSGTPDIAVTGGAGRTLTIRSATISNDGVSKSGSGKVILAKMANTLTGDISVAGGTFMIGATANDGVSRQLGGGNFTGNIDIAAGATFEFWTGTYSDQEFSGVISGGGNVKLAYRGTYTLSGANTYTGKTTIHGEYNGNLAQLNVSSFNSVVSGSIETGSGTVATPLPSSSLGAPTTVANGTVDIGRWSMQASALLNYTGPGETTDRVMNLMSAGTVQIKGVRNRGTGTLTFTSPWTAGGAGFNENRIYIETDSDIILSGGNVPDGFITLMKLGNAKLSVSGPTTTYNNVQLYGGTLEVDSEINDGAVYVGAVGTTSGSNLITVPAGTPIAEGMSIVHPRFGPGTTIVAITDINANPVEAQVSNNASATANLNGYIGFKGSLGIFAPAASNLRWLGNATLKYDGPDDSTNRAFTIDNDFTSTWEIIGGSTLSVSGGTASTSGALAKTGAGTLALSGTQQYTGATTVTTGTLALVGGSQASPITVASGASLGFTLGFPTTSTQAVDLTNGTVKITGTVDNSSDYKLMTADLGFTFTDLNTQLGTPITDYELQLQNGNTELWLVYTGGAGGTPYDTWAAGTFANPFTNTAPGVDFDNDGLSNLLEFVLGGDPTISQAGIAPSVSTSGTDLVVTFKRSDASELAPAVAVKVQLSTDLTFSTPAQDIVIGPASDPGPIAPSGASYTVSNSGGLDTIQVTIPQGSDPKKFARVQAVAP
jgi:autotransporter-associated beta strand protein